MPAMKSLLTAAFSLLLCALPPSVQATIYKYVDADGNVTFTDRYRPGAVKLVDTGKTPISASPSVKRGQAVPGTSPANFPRVTAETQRKRDDTRRTILLEERATEQKSLADVRSALASGRQLPDAELSRLRESLRLHEKNLELLDKELARAR